MSSFLRGAITGLVAVLLAVPTSGGPAESVSVTTLPNELKVITREGRSVNLAAVDIWVKAGSINESEENSGVSHFVEHMIFKATEKYGPGRIDRDIEGLGAELNGGTSKDWVHFYTTVASEHLKTALDALADAVMNARFRPEDLEKERRVILDEIARAESDPVRRAFDLFSSVAFAVHPYRLPATGTRESIAKLTREDLVSYYAAHYTPSNTCVAIVGDVARAEAVALVKQAFSGFERKGVEAPAATNETVRSAARIRRFRSTTNQAYVVLGFPAPSVSDFKDVCALDVILAALGDTHRGRISSALAANGVRFSKISVDFIVQRDPTTFSVLAAVDTLDADRVAPVLLTELRRLAKEALPPEELSQARRLVEGSDLFEQETFSGQARTLGLYDSIASCNLGLQYASIVRGITARDIMAAAGKYFSGEGYTLVLLEP